MKKKYWWRIYLLAFGLVIISISYILKNKLLFGICNNIYQTEKYQECLDNEAYTLGNILMILTSALLLVSPFLFFVRDEVFKKWLWFALVWFGTAIFFIAITPEYHAGIFEMMNPTKETVSMFFGILFVPISLGKLAWDSRRTA